MQRPNIPMSTLRVFESAARLLSFEKAGLELNISASAVSQQIARLEDKLGLLLFERLHRRIALTDSGRALYKPLTGAFKTIDQALSIAFQSASKESIKIAIYQTWASRWLIPRLSDFSRSWPQLSVEFATGMEDVDLEHTNIDFAVRWHRAGNERADAYKLFDEILVAVCSPSIATNLKQGSQLNELSLIQSVNRPDDWTSWMAASGLVGIHGASKLKFSNTSLAIDAAVAGAGILVGQVHLFLSEIESGSLMLLLGSGAKTGLSLYLLESNLSAHKKSTAPLRNWLIREAKQTAARVMALNNLHGIILNNIHT